MRLFECKACGGVQYSAAALKDQRYPNCIACGSPRVEEYKEEDDQDEPK